MDPIFRRGIVVVALVLASAGVSGAAYDYRYIAGPSGITAGVGETFLVDVFVRETVTGTDLPRLTGAGNGLFSAGVRLTFGASAPARVLSASDILPNNAAGRFGDTITAALAPGGGSALLFEQVGLVAPFVPGTPIGPGASQVLLGSFRFTALAEGVVNFTIGDIDAATAETVTGAGFVLDPLLAAGGGTITVVAAAVPEPGSIVALGTGLVGVGLALRARGRGHS